MGLTAAEKTAVEEIVNTLVAYTGPGRGRRRLAELFMDLVDKDDYPEYYEVCFPVLIHDETITSS